MDKFIYGRTNLFKKYCKICDDYSLVPRKQKYCECGVLYQDEEISEIYIVCAGNRRYPASIRNALRKRQNNKCFWCGKNFGEFIYKRGRVIQLRMHVDHNQPFAFTQSSDPENLVAACHICNGFKSSLCFKDNDDCRRYIITRWQQEQNKGHIDDI